VPTFHSSRMDQTNAKNDITLEIESLSYGPYGVGRVDGRVLMIPATVPGDKLTARVVTTKGNYAIGEIVGLIEPSRERQAAPCPYAGECGGCPWQQVQYKAQLQAKQKSVEDTLRRIGRLDQFELRPIIPCSDQFHYRRRVRLQVDEMKRLGFYHAASHRVVEIGSCLIAAPQADRCIEALRNWLQQIQTPLECIEVVTGDEPDETVIVANSPADFILNDESACTELLRRQPYIRGLIVSGRNWRKTWGQTRVSLNPEAEIRLVVEADVFTQINPEGNRKVLRELLAAGEFAASDRVLELYCGAGNFTLSLARRIKEVVAVEGDRRSVDSGKLSAQLNRLDNVRWINAHVPAALERLIRWRERFTKIVLDPPRAGAKGIDRQLASFGAAKIVYVSCNPATLARDASALTKHGYKLSVVQPIDLFPHTFHVEVIATLTS
jgi:23S rRNA (uracil1939-C5)-methyltransferase